MAKEEEAKEQIISTLSGMLRKVPFTFKFEVKKKPTGIHIVCDVTQEEMDVMMAKQKNE